MRTLHSELLTLLGYVLGLLLTPLAGRMASPWVGGVVLDDVMIMCEVLFGVALLLGVIRLLFGLVTGRLRGEG